MTTLSFPKVIFSAQEVLDLISDSRDDGYDLEEFELRFLVQAEDRSRENR